MTLFNILSERFLARLVVSLFILAFCAKAFGQGPTRTTTTHKCSGEVITRVHVKPAVTPRHVGTCNYVRPGGKPAWIMRFNRWSSKRKRVHRKFKVGSRR